MSLQIYDHQTSSLQCPLCTATTQLILQQKVLGEISMAWLFICLNCKSEIVMKGHFSLIQIKNMLAYRLPEIGKEFQDLAR